MRARRGPIPDRLLCAGPGRLTQALGLTGADNGARLEPPRFSLVPPDRTSRITRTPRIGITRATELDWRYVEAGTSWSSRPVRRAA
jgi:DNA-3-methyladenine glycosylase